MVLLVAKRMSGSHHLRILSAKNSVSTQALLLQQSCCAGQLASSSTIFILLDRYKRNSLVCNFTQICSTAELCPRVDWYNPAPCSQHNSDPHPGKRKLSLYPFYRLLPPPVPAYAFSSKRSTGYSQKNPKGIYCRINFAGDFIQWSNLSKKHRLQGASQLS